MVGVGAAATKADSLCPPTASPLARRRRNKRARDDVPDEGARRGASSRDALQGAGPRRRPGDVSATRDTRHTWDKARRLLCQACWREEAEACRGAPQACDRPARGALVIPTVGRFVRGAVGEGRGSWAGGVAHYGYGRVCAAVGQRTGKRGTENGRLRAGALGACRRSTTCEVVGTLHDRIYGAMCERRLCAHCGKNRAYALG